MTGGEAALEWYHIVFELIDMRSFSNLWYWIALAVLWSSASHWVIGVPFDMVSRARRHGGQAEADLDTLAAVNARRLLYIADVAGLWLVAAGAFVLTALAILGFGYGVEFAQAVVLMALPMTIVFALSVRTARRITALQEGGAALRRRLAWHRLAIQGIGMVAILVTAMFGMYQNMNLGNFG
jgi:hypothetical protein